MANTVRVWADNGFREWDVSVGCSPICWAPGFATPDGYNAAAGTVLNACTSTAGWAADSLAASTAHGFPTIYGKVPPWPGSVMYVDLPAPVSTAGYSRAVVRARWKGIDGFVFPTLTGWYTIKVASSTALAGTVVSVPFPAVPDDEFVDITVDLDGLTEVRSVGVKPDGGMTVGGGRNVEFEFAVVRYANETEIDRAVSTLPAAVFIPPGYTPTVGQDPPTVHPDRVLVDLRAESRHISRLNRTRHLYEWGTPHDDEDQTALIMRATQGVPDGSTLLFPADETFLVDHTWWVLGKKGVTIDLNGSTIYTRVWRGGNNNVSDNIVAFAECRDVTFRNGRIFGWRDRTAAGSELANDGGTPTTVSTTKTLDAQNEAVKAPQDRWYARHPLAQYPPTTRALIAATYPTFHLGNVFTFTLSDTHQVADDCVIEVVAFDDDTVLAARTLTLTATPTVYVLAYEPGDLHRKWKVRARKATTSTNTVTVTDLTEYGVCGYDDDHDSASAVVASGDVRRVTIEDVWVEGATTDAFDFSNADTHQVTVRRCVSHKASRQGMSFNQGTGYLLEDFEIGECGRSGIDVEPFAEDWFVRGLTIRRGSLHNVTNYAFAAVNWSRVFNLHVDQVTVDGAGLGLIIGGGVDSSFTNVRSEPSNDQGYSAVAAYVNGIRMRVAGLQHRGFLQVETVQVAYDGVTYTPHDNTVSDVVLVGDDAVLHLYAPGSVASNVVVR